MPANLGSAGAAVAGAERVVPAETAEVEGSGVEPRVRVTEAEEVALARRAAEGPEDRGAAVVLVEFGNRGVVLHTLLARPRLDSPGRSRIF
jgi:hypothetical protein